MFGFFCDLVQPRLRMIDAFCIGMNIIIEHLFFKCEPPSSLWHFCWDRWNISMCILNHTKECLLSWMGVLFRRFDNIVWISMFYVISRPIWNIQNKAAFQYFKLNWKFEKNWLIWRLDTWAKGWCPNLPFLRPFVLRI